MIRIYFCVTYKILAGAVACKYCFKKDIYGIESLKAHFERCEKRCPNYATCICEYCSRSNTEIIRIGDTENVYINSNTVDAYFSIPHSLFWDTCVPKVFLILDNGTLLWWFNFQLAVGG
jgi:hypothetical protein